MTADGLHPTFVVLGMHRSGTSAVAGALVRRGADAGRALLPSTSDNANGYFEDTRLVAASDLLLAAGGLRWDEPGPIPRPLDASAVQTAVAQMLGVFASLRESPAPGVVKDPRACRLVAEWSLAMDAAKLRPLYLIVLRDPREVAASLAARDGITAFRAEQLWIEHLLEAEHATRGAPRVFVEFGELLQQPEAVLDAALKSLGAEGLSASDSAQGTGVESALRRQRAAAEPGGSVADEVYAFARRLAGTPGTEASTTVAFDGFRARWLHDAGIARSALADAAIREARARESASRLAQDVRSGLALADAWVPAPRRDVAPRVYWRSAADDYAEDRSRGAVQGQGASWSVTAGGSRRVDFLRIDPDERAGVFELRGLRVAGVPMPLPAASIPRSSGVLREGGEGLMLIALDDDPWLEVAVDLPAGADVVVELDIVYRGLPELLWSLVHQEATGAARLRSLESRLDALAHRVEGWAGAESARHATLAADLARHSADVQAALATQDAELSALRQGVEGVSRQSEELLGWTRRRTFRYWWRRWRGETETPEGTP